MQSKQIENAEVVTVQVRQQKFPSNFFLKLSL